MDVLLKILEIIKTKVLTFIPKIQLYKNVYVRLSELYSKGETYEGNLIVNGEMVAVSKQLQPDHILSHFTHQTDHWDDVVEVDYQFQVKKVNIEFSWHWQADTLIPNYIGIEID